jgi:NADH:ubiquinone oxidoreductase subunit F (NADH-binding)
LRNNKSLQTRTLLSKKRIPSTNKTLNKKPLEVVEDIKKSGLRGRGGAGFPTGLKWSFLAEKKEKKYLICNGDEGDPGAFMNRTLMESDPYKIIEGMTIGAYATGCEEGIIYTRAEYPLAIKILQNAIDEAYKKNLLGQDILGKKTLTSNLKYKKEQEHSFAEKNQH